MVRRIIRITVMIAMILCYLITWPILFPLFTILRMASNENDDEEDMIVHPFQKAFWRFTWELITE